MSLKTVTEEFNEATVRDLIRIGLKSRDLSVNQVTRIERKRDKHGDRYLITMDIIEGSS